MKPQPLFAPPSNNSKRLPHNQQEVVRLKFQNGFSYKEISRITQLSVTNVGFLIHTAVKALRRKYADAGTPNDRAG